MADSNSTKEPKNSPSQIKERSITEEMRESYIDYAMSVIVARALPDVRDGLKPVHRRILYTMYEDRLYYNASFRKSATVVGACLSRYHPHGDIAVYDSLVRLAQNFSLRYPLVASQGNFGCFTKDTKVRLTDGRSLNFEELIKEQKRGKKHWTFSFNNQTKKIEIAEIKNPRLTRKKEKIIEITIDNGEKIKCTLDHRFMLKDGSYKEAQYLEPGDSLMPLYTKLYNGKDRNLKGYEMVYHPQKNNWQFIHHLADFWNLEKRVYKKENGRIRHHKDFNKFNNNPNNIVRIQWQDHWEYHKEIASVRHKTDSEYRKKIGQGRIKFWNNEENRRKYSERLSKRNLLNWRKKGYRGKMIKNLSEANKKYFREHPEAVKRLSKTASATLKRLWQDPKYRNLFHEKIVASNKRRKTNLTGKKKFLRICKFLKNNHLPLNEKNFETIKKEVFGTKSFTSWKLGLAKYYDNSPDLITVELNKNHKVIKSKILKRREDVYDLTVEKWHNFSLAAGVFVHNSIDGDPPAAQRYTECKLSEIGQEMLRDIEKDTVNFVDNYDGTKREPIVLPSPAPQLLLNGALGIAVGMATNIPPHNLGEVCDAAIHIVDNPDAETSDLFQWIQGPDFPTGGIIYDQKGIISAYSQGKGKIVMRGKADVERLKNGGARIVITEIPYQVQKSSLVARMADLVVNKKIKGVRDVRDLSDREGMRIVIDTKKGFNPRRILNRLYKFTDLQKNFYLNMLALVDGIQPKILSLADVLRYFVEHRKEVVIRRTKFDLEKAKARAHILEGLSIALKNIDAVIETIKKSADRDKAKINLMKKFKLTDKQAEAILQIRLQSLVKLEREKIEEELKALKEKIKELTLILKSPKKIKEIVKKELKELKEKYGDERKTKVVKSGLKEINEADLVPLQEVVITLTKGGYIKRINPATYKIQKRGGKGIIGMKTMKGDIVEHFLSASTHDSLLFFTDSGKVFQTKVYEIPEANRVARGRGLLNFLEISSEENVLSIIPIKKEEEQGIKYLLIATKDGKIKKTSLDKFKNVRRSGIKAIHLTKNDLVRKVAKTTGKDDIILVTKKGKSIRFNENEARPMGRGAAGVKGIRLSKGDEVIGANVIRPSKKKKYLLVVTENGYGKRTEVSKYKAQKRGGSGIKTANITKKTGNIVIASILKGEEKDLIVISQYGQVIRIKIDSISILNRATQGVRIMKLNDKDKVASGTCI